MVIGITGGVGAGKSKVLEYLEEKGAYVLFSDDIARRLSETEGEALDRIRQLFVDDDVLTEDGFMDRAAVAALIFENEEKRCALEKILHEATRQEIKTKINNIIMSTPDRLIILESAIFFEAGCDELCDKCIYIRADEDVRRRRLGKTRGYTDEKTDSIMKNQLSDAEFAERCDYVVDNSGDFKKTASMIDAVLEDIAKK